jgi:hypothetical protein
VPITEGFMQVGAWDLRLSPQTPLSLRSVMERYDQIVVTPSRVPASDASRSDAVANARYRGPVLELSEDRTRLAGAGMNYYLTFGAGPTFGPPGATAWDWDDYTADFFDFAGITLGTTYDVPATTWPKTTADTQDDIPRNKFDALLFLAGVLGCEFYVTPDRTFHSGGASSSSLFTTTPEVILVRGQSGRDIDLNGLDLVSWNVAEDAWDHISYAYVIESDAGIVGSFDASLAVWEADGGSGERYTYEESNTTDGTDLVTKILADNAPRRTVEVSVNTYDPGRWMKPGDYVYAYLVFGLTGLFLTSALFFALATATRSMMATYIGATALLILWVIMGTLTARQEMRELAAWLDPFGGIALGEAIRYYTTFDSNTRRLQVSVAEVQLSHKRCTQIRQTSIGNRFAD